VTIVTVGQAQFHGDESKLQEIVNEMKQNGVKIVYIPIDSYDFRRVCDVIDSRYFVVDATSVHG